MNTKGLHTSLLLLFVVTALSAQKIDTTQRINTWSLQHNYTRFEATAPDTSIEDFHRIFNPLNRNLDNFSTLGILGNAAQNVDFLKRPASGYFLFGNVLQPYLNTPENTIFYNTRVPFTEISYTTIPFSTLGGKEETASVLHTQNLDPFTNFGFRLDLASGEASYSHDNSQLSNFTFFGSHAENKYAAFGSFHLNNYKLNENGGLMNPLLFMDSTITTMNLSAATSQVRNISVFFTQKYNLQERITTSDSLGNKTTKGQNISLAHQFSLTNNMRKYNDLTSTTWPSIYDTCYYPLLEVQDSVREDKLSNVLQLIWGDPYGEHMSARAYAGHELRKFSYTYPETGSYFHHMDTLSESPLLLDSAFRDTVRTALSKKYYNDLFLGFHLAGPTGKKWDWNLDGKYYLAGYYANNFNLDLSLKRVLGQNGLIGINASYALEKPNYYIESYSSAFFRWNNDFAPLLSARAEGFLRYGKLGSELRIRATQLTNLVYWDTDALPRQATVPVYLVSASIRQHLAAGGFHSDNRLLLQLPSDQQIIPLPLLSFYTSDYWEQSLFKGALIAQLGFDLYITTKYYGDSYMPATAVFYHQNDTLTGGFPFLDAFVNWKIKRTRFFFSWNNVLSDIAGRNYFTTWRYPQKPRYFRFGVIWTFYD
ncbi:MAG: putative porin [Bacteroidota bacterium]